jgi:O-antigen ligase
MLIKTVRSIGRASVIFMWLLVAFLLSGATGTMAQKVTFCTLLAVLVFWAIWPVVTERSLDEIIHANQQASLKRFHRMQARDRREREHRAWWKSLGIGK